MRRTLLIFISLIFLWAGANGLAQLSSPDNAALVYQDAAKLLREIPRNDPGFVKRAAEVIDNGWSAKSDDLKPLVLKNAQAIAEFKKGAEKEDCDFTLGEEYRRGPGEKIPNYSDALTLARLALMQGRLFERQKKMDAALDNYLAVLRLEYHLNRQLDHALLSQMIGAIVQKMVYPPAADFIKRKDVTLKQISRLSAQMNAVRRGFLGLDRVFADEREFTRAAGESVTSFDEKGSYKREFMKEFNAREDEIFALLNKAYARNDSVDLNKLVSAANERSQKEIQERQRLNPAFPKDITASMQDQKGALSAMFFYGPKVMARYLAGIGASQYSGVITAHYIARVNFDLLRTAAAIRGYELKNHKLPDKLLALTPDYLDVVPADPFNLFRPVKYLRSKKDWCVYSLGPDRNDDQAKIAHSGNTAKAEEKGDLMITGE